MSRRAWSILLLLGLLLALGWRAGQVSSWPPPPSADRWPDGGGRTAAGASAAPPVRRAPAPSATGASPRATAALSTGLPPPGAALVDHYASLVERAERGEVAAAQRLYQDLEACRSAAMGKALSRFGRDDEQAPELEPGLDATARDGRIRYWLADQARHCQLERLCRGLQPQQPGERLRWLLRAAELGDVDARLHFARGTFFHLLQRLEDYDYLPLWQSRALPWLHEAVAAGHAGAYDLLGSMLAVEDRGGRQPMLAQLLPHDPVRAYAYLHAAARSAGYARQGSPQMVLRKALEATAARLDPARLALARTRGDALYQRHRTTLDRTGPDRPELAWLEKRMKTPAEIARIAPECLEPGRL